SAPKHAGLNDANPTAFLLSACMMLDHIGYQEEGDRVRAAINSCFDNIELCTKDLGGKASTTEYTQHIIDFL
ncbi:MAG TPA: isocitrate/isopropylmalate family dehydrogenase, partial [Candidatus Eisenbacteria bacterium]|nr:isocitrate/isopropylmalate family dehydrogenase [Candidatus Eisenbacteria bacterium]